MEALPCEVAGPRAFFFYSVGIRPSRQLLPDAAPASLRRLIRREYGRSQQGVSIRYRVPCFRLLTTPSYSRRCQLHRDIPPSWRVSCPDVGFCQRACGPGAPSLAG